MPVRAPLLADGPGDLGPVSELLEGVPWPVRAIVVLIVMTSAWWGPKLAGKRRQRRARRAPTRVRDRDIDQEQDQGEEDPDSDELLDLRDSLIDVLQKLQAESRKADDLARRLAQKDAALEHERAQAAQLAQDLEQWKGEVAKLRQQVDALIERRERTPPHGQPETDTTALPRRPTP